MSFEIEGKYLSHTRVLDMGLSACRVHTAFYDAGCNYISLLSSVKKGVVLIYFVYWLLY